MKVKYLFSSVLMLISGFAFSQIPEGYYNAATNKTGAELKTTFFNIIRTHDTLAYKQLWTAYATTDVDENGYVYDIYSSISKFKITNDQCGSYTNENDCYNREHTFPKSWFNDAVPMNTDLMHILPSDGFVNAKRSNYPIGETNGEIYKSNNGFSKLGASTTTGYTDVVFEPNDEYKGDFARIYFYMATAYEDKIADWSSPMLAKNSYPAFASWAVDMLLRWAETDPVSQKEIDRNNAVYQIQGNRNPFVDHPEYAKLIWDDNTLYATENEEFIYSVTDNEDSFKLLQCPKWLKFSQVSSATAQVSSTITTFKGTPKTENIGTSQLKYSISIGGSVHQILKNIIVQKASAININDTVNQNDTVINNDTINTNIIVSKNFENPTNTDNVIISAIIPNATSAILYWGISANAVGHYSIPMTKKASLFTAEIFGARIGGVHVYYYIDAQTADNKNIKSEVYTYSIESTTDISDNCEASINIYPNPITDVLNIDLGETKTCKISIFNSLGLLVYNKIHEQKALKIETTDWKQGVYVIYIETKQQRMVAKIVK